MSGHNQKIGKSSLILEHVHLHDIPVSIMKSSEVFHSFSFTVTDAGCESHVVTTRFSIAPLYLL